MPEDRTFIREWFVEGHLIFNGTKLADNIWHPLYGPLPEHEAKRLLGWMLDADDEQLNKLDRAMDEYDDFRVKHHPEPMATKQLIKRKALVRADAAVYPDGGTLLANSTESPAHRTIAPTGSGKSGRKKLSKTSSSPSEKKIKIKVRR